MEWKPYELVCIMWKTEVEKAILIGFEKLMINFLGELFTCSFKK